mmetsp:Transcript_19127/g.50276  ORF Transcript_19127/g.50276 Transcript_19127/m.50276 type:complete len:263 (-) Transcript_19127:63-851(-)
MFSHGLDRDLVSAKGDIGQDRTSLLAPRRLRVEQHCSSSSTCYPSCFQGSTNRGSGESAETSNRSRSRRPVPILKALCNHCDGNFVARTGELTHAAQRQRPDVHVFVGAAGQGGGPRGGVAPLRELRDGVQGLQTNLPVRVGREAHGCGESILGGARVLGPELCQRPVPPTCRWHMLLLCRPCSAVSRGTGCCGQSLPPVQRRLRKSLLDEYRRLWVEVGTRCGPGFDAKVFEESMDFLLTVPAGQANFHNGRHRREAQCRA